jgi:hypothetical protein
MYKKMKSGLGLALVLLMLASIGYAQSGNLADNPTSGSLLSQSTQKSPPPSANANANANAKESNIPGSASPSFAVTCDYHSNYVGSYNCGGISGVYPWSQVFASICEYGSDPNTCFQGAAFPRITDVIPGYGHVNVGVDPNWPYYPINLRLMIHVD